MDIVLAIHDLLRWLVLIFAIWTIFSAISGLNSRRKYTSGDGKANFFFMLSMDIQILIGFILYFNNGWFERLKHLGDNMKVAYTRFFTMEHVLIMLIAWVLVHIGRIVVKKETVPRKKFKKTLIYFGIALLLILLAIPWPFREEIARPWFRGF